MTPDLSSAELLQAYQAKIRRHILSIVRDPDEGRRSHAGGLLQAHRKLASLRDQDAVATWL